MRPALYLGLITALLLAAPSACRAGGARPNGPFSWVMRAVGRAAAEAQPPADAQADKGADARPAPPPRDAPRVDAKPAPPLFVSEEVGYGTDENSARKVAWEVAADRVRDYLANEAPDIHWTPTPTQLQARNMARDLGEPFLDKKTEHFKATVKVELTAEHLQGLREQQRLQVVQQRQRLAGLGLAGAMALLAVVGGYLRLEEKTRGFYTGLLRAAAAAVLALVGVGLWMLS
jgi:hypothetical protein